MRVFFSLLATCLAAPVTAQTALPCDWQAAAHNIVEPWEENTVTFADGNVRVALLDVAEPAAAAFYLLILHPPVDIPGVRTCTVVGVDDGLGYASIDFNDLEAGYNAETGLTLTVPAGVYRPEQSQPDRAILLISVNQATGQVSVSQQIAPQ